LPSCNNGEDPESVWVNNRSITEYQQCKNLSLWREEMCVCVQVMRMHVSVYGGKGARSSDIGSDERGELG